LQAPAYFLDVNSWQTDYNEFNRARVPDSIAEPAAKRYYSAMERAKQAPFAVLDDIGVRQATEGFRGDLHSVINYRVTNAMPTVYTSNLPIEDMARVFDNRLYDRMRDMCAELKFEGESKRGRR
jgi:DNA replication protein DnaC